MTPANEQDRDQVQQLTQKVQEVTGETVGVASVSSAYPDAKAAQPRKASVRSTLAPT